MNLLSTILKLNDLGIDVRFAKDNVGGVRVDLFKPSQPDFYEHFHFSKEEREEVQPTLNRALINIESGKFISGCADHQDNLIHRGEEFSVSDVDLDAILEQIDIEAQDGSN